MAKITGLTADRMLAIEAMSITGGSVDLNGDLILTQRDGTQVNAGKVKGSDGLPVYRIALASNDGTLDVTSEIQIWLNWMRDNDGGTLFLPKGLYRITSELTIYSNTKIKGEGVGNTILLQAGAGKDCLVGTNIRSVNVEDISIVGDGTYQGCGIKFGYSGDAPEVWSPGLPTVPYYINLKNVEVRGFSYGVYLQTPIVSHLENVVAVGNDFGFYFPEAGTSTTFTSCWARSNRKAGYFLHWLVYSNFSACAADFNGISYYAHQCQTLTFNSCGSEKSEINSVSWDSGSIFGTAEGQALFDEEDRGASWVLDGCNTITIQSCEAINTNGFGVHVKNGRMMNNGAIERAGTSWENHIFGFASNNEEGYTGGKVKTETNTSSTLLDIRAALDCALNSVTILNDGGGSMVVRTDLTVGHDLHVKNDSVFHGAGRFLGAFYMGTLEDPNPKNLYAMPDAFRTDFKVIADLGLGTGGWQWATGTLPAAPSSRFPIFGTDGALLGWVPIYQEAF